MTPTRRPLAEKDICFWIEQNFRLHGWKVVNTHGDVNHRPMHLGIADYIVVKYGFHAWIESKKPGYVTPEPGEKMTKTERAQMEFRQMIREAGATYVMIRDLEELSADLARLDAKAEKYRQFK